MGGGSLASSSVTCNGIRIRLFAQGVIRAVGKRSPVYDSDFLKKYGNGKFITGKGPRGEAPGGVFTNESLFALE